MKILGELEPTKNNEKLAKRVEKLAGVVDAIDIPEAPMGKPIAHAAILAAYIKAKYGIDAIPHVRVSDLNTVGLLSILGGLRATGIEEAVLLKGDPPIVGKEVEELTVESAAEVASSRLSGRPRLGAMMSLRYSLEAITKRLQAPLDFYLVLRPSYSLEKLEQVSKLAKSLNKRLYTYIIVASSRNYPQLREMLVGQPVYNIDEAVRFATKIQRLVDGILISSPGDVDAISETAQRIKRELRLD